MRSIRLAFDGLLLPGGHRARGMRDFLESEILQRHVAHFFDEEKPVGRDLPWRAARRAQYFETDGTLGSFRLSNHPR